MQPWIISCKVLGRSTTWDVDPLRQVELKKVQREQKEVRYQTEVFSGPSVIWKRISRISEAPVGAKMAAKNLKEQKDTVWNNANVPNSYIICEGGAAFLLLNERPISWDETSNKFAKDENLLWGQPIIYSHPRLGSSVVKKDPVFLLSFADQHFQVSAPST